MTSDLIRMFAEEHDLNEATAAVTLAAFGPVVGAEYVVAARQVPRSEWGRLAREYLQRTWR